MKEEKYNTEQKQNVWPLRARRRGLSAVRGEKKDEKMCLDEAGRFGSGNGVCLCLITPFPMK